MRDCLHAYMAANPDLPPRERDNPTLHSDAMKVMLCVLQRCILVFKTQHQHAYICIPDLVCEKVCGTPHNPGYAVRMDGVRAAILRHQATFDALRAALPRASE